MNSWLISGLLLLAQAVGIRGYSIDASGSSFRLVDVRTNMTATTLFVDEPANIILEGLMWSDLLSASQGDEDVILHYRTFVNGEFIYQGYKALPEDPSELSVTMYVGTFNPNKSGTSNVEVEIRVGQTLDIVSTEFQAFRKFVALIPLVLIFVLGAFRRAHAVYTLTIGLFVGACIATGGFFEGFKALITVYILGAVSESYHIYLYAFTVIAAGLAAMMRRSGGVSGVVKSVSKRLDKKFGYFGQVILVVLGVLFFLDPNFSIIFIAEVFTPIIGLFAVSIEKYAFFLHATSVSISAFNPVSSLAGFSSNLIQSQLEKLVEMGFDGALTSSTGWAIFRKSIRYQFYPIFLLCFLVLMVATQRDMGPMLITERRRWLSVVSGERPKRTLRENIARPDEDTPRYSHNMFVPVIFWFGAILLTFALINEPTAEDNAATLMAGLVYCTIGVAVFIQVYYLLQTKETKAEEEKPALMIMESQDYPGQSASRSDETANSKNADFILEHLESADPESERNARTALEIPQSESTEQPTKVKKAFVSLPQGAQCFFNGGATVIPVLMTLTLAWATTELFLELGLDRIFAYMIDDGKFTPEMSPTIGFLVSFLLTLATGSFAAAQSIAIPLLCVPIYVASNGNDELLFAVIGAVLSGSVLGDQTSPISTSTILSTYMIECDMRDHLLTQSPFILFVGVTSVLLGHLPSAQENCPWYACYIVGLVLMCLFLYFFCERVGNEDGKYDLITERFFSNFKSLRDLKIHIRLENGIEVSKVDLAGLDTQSGSKDEDSKKNDHRGTPEVQSSASEVLQDLEGGVSQGGISFETGVVYTESYMHEKWNQYSKKEPKLSLVMEVPDYMISDMDVSSIAASDENKKEGRNQTGSNKLEGLKIKTTPSEVDDDDDNIIRVRGGTKSLPPPTQGRLAGAERAANCPTSPKSAFACCNYDFNG